MAGFNPQLGNSLNSLYTLGTRLELPPFFDPALTFNPGTIDLAIPRDRRLPFELSRYLDGMSNVTAISATTAESGRQHIVVTGRTWNTQLRPPRLTVGLTQEATGDMLACDILATPATPHRRSTENSLVARVPVVVLIAEREGTLSEEYYNEWCMPRIKDLVDALGGLMMDAAIDYHGPSAETPHDQI